VNNGSEVINALEKNNDYALVLMDCMMPVMNGYETTAVIRDPASKVRNHSIPVIALTANAMREDRDKCLAAGMDDYLSKPIDVAVLMALLENWAPADRGDKGHDSRNIELQGTDEGSETLLSESAKSAFDLDEFVRRNLGDLVLSRDVAAIFVSSATKYIDSIRNELAARDNIALCQSVHKLKGAAANIALPLVSETVQLIESYAKNGDLDKAEEVLPDLEKQLERALDAIRELLISTNK
jgi:pentatricopeptide repeat protein